MKRRTTALAATAAMAASVLLLSACAPGNTTQSESTAKATSSAALPATAWKAATASQVKQGGTLKLALSAAPANMNTFEVDGNETNALNLQAPTSGGPVRITSDGGWEVDKDYASSVKLTGKSPQTIEVKLNPDAVWEDGTPITVDDWKATFTAMSGKDTKYQIPSSSGYDSVKSVGAVDGSKTDFTVTFAKSYADWPGLFTSVLPATVASDVKAFNSGYISKPTPSDGPYVLSDADTNGGVFTMTPNPKWWGDEPKLDSVIFKVISSDSQASSFANKEIDALEIASDADAYQTAKQRSDASIQTSGGLTWTHVTMNAAKGPLKDVLVRQAIGHAINRKVISQSANTPVGAPAEEQNSYIFMPGQKGYQDDATPSIGYSPTKAKALLAKDGYEQADDDTWSKGSVPLKLTMTIPADTPTNKQRAVQVQADLKDIGIPVELNEVPAAKFFNYVIKGDFEMTGFSWQGTAFPIGTTEPLFYPLKSGSNFTGTTKKQLGAMWDAANAELDPAKRIALANSIDKELFSYAPIIPLAPLPNVYAVKKGLVNYGAAQFQTSDWTTVGFAK